MKTKLIPLAACLLSLFSIQSTQAAAVLQWDFSEDYTSSSLVAQDISEVLNPDSNYNTLRRSSVNLIGTPIQDNWTTIDWNVTNTFNTSSDFIYFNVSPAAGETLTFTDLVYTLTGSSNAPGTGLWGYRLTLDGTQQAWVYQDEFAINDIGSAAKQTWDFDDITITASDSIQFRFWAYGTISVDGGASSTGGQIRFVGNEPGYNMTLNAIPEPSSSYFGIGALALGFLLFLRKRSKR